MSALVTLGGSALLLGVLLAGAHLFEKYDPNHPAYQERVEPDTDSTESEDETTEPETREGRIVHEDEDGERKVQYEVGDEQETTDTESATREGRFVDESEV